MNNTIKKILKGVSVAAVVTAFVMKPQASSQGARQALELCFSTVVPSLFPFMTVSAYILNSDVLSVLGKRSERLCRFLFDLPKEAGMIFLMSMLGGFPVGARLIADSLQKGRLTGNQAKRMLLFCVNPGPAFAVNVVGVSMLGSQRAGVIILASLCLSSLITGIISRVFSNGEEVGRISPPCASPSPLISSVKESVSAIMGVCGWIVIFSAVLGVVNSFALDETMKQWLNMTAEVTGGCRICTQNFPLPVTALILGWSGACVHLQLMPCISLCGLKYKHFAVARIFNGVVSMVISFVLFRIFPCETSVFSNAGEIVPGTVSVSVPATAGLLFLSALIILDLAPKRKV